MTNISDANLNTPKNDELEPECGPLLPPPPPPPPPPLTVMELVFLADCTRDIAAELAKTPCHGQAEWWRALTKKLGQLSLAEIDDG